MLPKIDVTVTWMYHHIFHGILFFLFAYLWLRVIIDNKWKLTVHPNVPDELTVDKLLSAE